MKRQKTRLEKWFSFSRHRRRAGSKKIAAGLSKSSLEALKSRIIDAGELKYTHGSEVSLQQHIENLKQEFVGQSELCHYQASLIVKLRREIDESANFAAFEKLWDEFGDFFLETLNTRWLVAAADTFADHSKRPAEQACALAVTALVNTVKLCETERLVTDAPGINQLNSKNVDLQKNRFPLWDGTSAFAVGTDDTLRNFHWRLDRFLASQGKELHTALILKAVFVRLQVKDNIYKRFRDCHHRNRTEWW